MIQISRFLTPVLAPALAAAAIVVSAPAANAQFFFWQQQPQQRAAPAHKPPRQTPAPRMAKPQVFDLAPMTEKASLNDTARFLAGMTPAEDSPLFKYTREPYWQQHARSFDNSWRELENRRLSKIRGWSAQHLKDRKAPLYYMFSGPDLLYADAFFPNATTYLFAGLEPVGQIPQINGRTFGALGNLRSSMASSISLSFFITNHMKSQLRETSLSGTLPILMVYAARAGKTIKDVSLVSIDNDGKLTNVADGATPRGVQGVKMVFGEPGKPEQTLYYFSTDISDSGVKNSGFLKFAESFGPGDAMFKAASYLPHSGGFSQIRDFVLAQAQNIVQDDSGIPIHAFKRDQWTFHPFGRYLGPIALFPGRHQGQLDEIFRKGQVRPLEFGMGYRWRPNESNMLWAVKKEQAPLRPSISDEVPQAAKPQPASPKPAEASAAPAVVPAPVAKPANDAAAMPVPASAPAPVPAAAPQTEAKSEANPAANPVAPKPVEASAAPASVPAAAPAPQAPAEPKPASEMKPAAELVAPPAVSADQSASSNEPVRR